MLYGIASTSRGAAMSNERDELLARRALAAGLINRKQLDQATALAAEGRGASPLDVLLERGWLSREQLRQLEEETTTPPAGAERESVSSLLLLWEDARQRGRILTPEELCSSTPHLL